jgi:galactokinase
LLNKGSVSEYNAGAKYLWGFLRMKDYAAAHEAEYGEAAEIAVSAPGGITLMGSHTEVSGGPVLRLVVPPRMWVVVSRRKDSSLRFFAADYGERKRTSIPNLKYRREDRWANIPKGAIAEVLGTGAALAGLNITVGGEVPQDAGLAASAALVVAMLTAIREVFELDVPDREMWVCAKRAEQSYGKRTSTLAPFVAAQQARDGYGVLFDPRSGEPQHIPLDLKNAVLAVTVTGVPQLPTESTFRSRARECSQGLKVLAKQRRGASLRDFKVSRLNEQMGQMPETVRRRCLHVIEEGQRVSRLSDALMHGDLSTAGRLLGKSHQSLRDLYEVSCPEVDWLVKHALEVRGVYGARLAGTGFGGSTVALVERDSLDAYHEVLEHYARIFGFRTTTFLASPTAGVDVHRRENVHTADQR